MKVEMIMPQMGESITEATIAKWLKQAGDAVKKDEIILEISTDKVDSEIPAPAAGILSEVLYKVGDVVPVKSKIAVIDTEGKATVSTNGSTAAAKPAAQESKAPAAEAPTSSSKDDSGDRFYSPLVKGLADKHRIPLRELDSIKGSGQGGRLTKQDFLDYVEKGGIKEAPQAPPQRPSPPAESRAPDSRPPENRPTQSKPSSPTPSNIDWGSDDVKVVPMDNMRQAIADHMVRSKQTSPHVYSVQDVDVSKIAKWRQMHKAKFEENEGFGLSFTPFFLEATVRAIVHFPQINCSVDGKKILLKKHIGLGCAVALGNTGLIVPVIKRAEEKNLVGLARGLNDLALRARNKKLSPDDVAGGTFTVTNPGVFGTIIGTPIINQPQVAILCLGAIKKRPVVIDDMIAIREMCYLTLSYDHREVDGSLSGQFLAFIREYLENWDMKRPLY
jgi:2-oxoglutarate dehydrogenase E2 component (dihydrolipoamide succinyltransferase)